MSLIDELSRRFPEVGAVQPSQPLTMAEAARLLGFGSDRAARRRLIYLVKKREDEIGEKILIGGGERGATQKVTIGALRAHYSELVGDDVYVCSILREFKQQLDDELRADRLYMKALGARVRKLETASRGSR